MTPVDIACAGACIAGVKMLTARPRYAKRRGAYSVECENVDDVERGRGAVAVWRNADHEEFHV